MASISIQFDFDWIVGTIVPDCMFGINAIRHREMKEYVFVLDELTRIMKEKASNPSYKINMDYFDICVSKILFRTLMFGDDAEELSFKMLEATETSLENGTMSEGLYIKNCNNIKLFKMLESFKNLCNLYEEEMLGDGRFNVNHKLCSASFDFKVNKTILSKLINPANNKLVNALKPIMDMYGKNIAVVVKRDVIKGKSKNK